MELLAGETLAERMKRTGPMAFVEAVAIMLPAMRGVGAAHAHGVIHRDLKPDNIFLCMDADGSIRECKVLDFGVSKLTVADAATTGDITLSGNVVGTPEYMAPEQVRAGKHADHRIDIYSLGVVFYEMIAGRPPFVGEHFSGLMLDIMQKEPPPLASLRADVPRRLASVIHRALARDLEKRYGDMPSFIAAVEEAGRNELKLAMGTPPEGLITQIAMPRLTPDGQFPAPRDRRLSTVAAVVGLALLFAAGLLWWDAARRGHPQEAVAPSSAPVAAPAAEPPAAPAAKTERPPAAVEAPAAPEAVEKPPAQAAPRPETGPAAEAKPAHTGTSHSPHHAGGPPRAERAEADERAKASPAPASPSPARSSTPRSRAGKLSVDDF
jgi:serine/threonine-protein kinase